MKAVILAAGRGSRLRPLTDEIPKPLVNVRGTPLIAYSVGRLIEAGILDIAVVVGHLGQSIIDYLTGNFYANFHFVRQHKQDGTASAVLLAEDFLTSDFLMLYGDTYFTPDAVKALALAGGDGAVGVVSSQNPEKYGCVVLSNDGYVKSIIEKPKFPPSNLVVMGGYRFPSSLIDDLKRIKLSERGELELPDAVRLSISRGLKYCPVDVGGSDDVATIDDVNRLNAPRVKLG